VGGTRGGDDRAGDRGVGLGEQPARRGLPQSLRHQGVRPGGQRRAADLGVLQRPVGDDRRAVPRVSQRRRVDRGPCRAAGHQRLLPAGDGGPRDPGRVRQRPHRGLRDRPGLRRQPHRDYEALQPVPVRRGGPVRPVRATSVSAGIGDAGPERDRGPDRVCGSYPVTADGCAVPSRPRERRRRHRRGTPGRRAGDHSRARFACPRAREHLGRERGRVSGGAPARRADTGRGRADRRQRRLVVGESALGGESVHGRGSVYAGDFVRGRDSYRGSANGGESYHARNLHHGRGSHGRRDCDCGCQRGPGRGCDPRAGRSRPGQLPAPACRRRDYRRPVPAAVHHGGDDRVFRHREGAGRARRAPLPRRGRADGHSLGATRRLRLDAVQGASAVLARARREDRRAQLRRDQLRYQVGRARAVRTGPDRTGGGRVRNRPDRAAAAVGARAGRRVRRVPLGGAAGSARRLGDGVPLLGGRAHRPAPEDALARHRRPGRA
jgi:hypothetical protein